MIDDKQTCDVCGEEFNEDRPHHEHDPKKTAPSALDAPKKGSRPDKKGVS